MLSLEKIDGTSKISYYYYPEGTKKPGIISIDPTTNEVYIEKLSAYDLDNQVTYFGKKARAKVYAMMVNNDFPDTAFFAWG